MPFCEDGLDFFTRTGWLVWGSSRGVYRRLLLTYQILKCSANLNISSVRVIMQEEYVGFEDFRLYVTSLISLSICICG